MNTHAHTPGDHSPLTPHEHELATRLGKAMAESLARFSEAEYQRIQERAVEWADMNADQSLSGRLYALAEYLEGVNAEEL